MNTKTELIAAWRIQPQAGKMKNDMIIVTTISGAEVWVNKHQFDTNAEQITYNVMKAGDEYTNKTGDKATLVADRNEFKGCSKQIIKKYDAKEMLDYMASKGMTNALSLS